MIVSARHSCRLTSIVASIGTRPTRWFPRLSTALSYNRVRVYRHVDNIVVMCVEVRTFAIAPLGFVPENTRSCGAGFESPAVSHMVFSAIYRSVFMRLLAAFIVVLVVSPYSEPFATMNGTDFGGAGAVDVGDASKLKPSTKDALAPPPIPAVVVGVFVSSDRPHTPLVALDSRRGQRAILRV